jgi:SAM-dependent methyltransferase
MKQSGELRDSGLGYDNAIYWESLHAARGGEFSAVGYPELGEGFNRATYKLRLHALERLLRRSRLFPVVALLEGGVGIGAYAPVWCKAQVKRWTGLDISPTAIEYMTRQFPSGRFSTADLCNREELEELLGESRFDLVTAIDILYHIVDDNNFAEALGNLARRVHPGCGFVISDIFCNQDLRIAPHVKRRSLRTYVRVLEPLGFRLVEREQVFAVIGHSEVPPKGVADLFVSAAWRVSAKLIRECPTSARNAVGAAVVHGLAPVDSAIRYTGLTKGSNLELALFRRSSL